MECSRTIAQLVVPVFYDVDSSHVCQHEAMSGETFKDLALRVLHIPGFVVDSRNESEAIRNVVRHVTMLLDTNLYIGEYPVGVESRVQDVIQLLNNQQSKDTLLLGIWGMGGIGKTTIAKATYNKLRHDFEASSFLSNVREFWEHNNNHIVTLQQQLLFDIYKTTEVNIDTVESGKIILHERLRRKKIFLVLDNVHKFGQLNALCGSREWFGPGSIIIITTRDCGLLSKVNVDHLYRVKGMDWNESLEFFSCYAFQQPIPIEGFTDISKDVVNYCGGLPLALEVIGCYLTGRSKQEWKCSSEKLKRIPNDQVLAKLRISFDDLTDDMKEMFLDIALFCIGMDKEDVTKILEDWGHNVDTGISTLVQRSLVAVDPMNKIGMHNMLQQMGRGIIRGKSTGVANKRIYDVFLSFRGDDCRGKFISHLYTSLQNAGIYVFRDDNEIQRGDKISLSLLEAIRKSKISIVVLSSNYANSKWCLQELENIMEALQKQGSGSCASVL